MKKLKPLTGKDLADMDMAHELKKSKLIKLRGVVTGAVTSTDKVPIAEVEAAVDAAHDVGRLEGVFEGANRMRRVINSCPVQQILNEVHKEVHKAQKKHAPMNGPHEAYAVILEEIDEYWDEVKADRGKQASARTELIQVAAMAVRALHDTNPR